MLNHIYRISLFFITRMERNQNKVGRARTNARVINIFELLSRVDVNRRDNSEVVFAREHPPKYTNKSILKNGIYARKFAVGRREVNMLPAKNVTRLIIREGILFLNKVDRKIDMVMKMKIFIN